MMKELGILYIERNNCENCYRCIRACALKAIIIKPGGTLVIDWSKCIGCGACISVCKAGVIKIRSDVHIARSLIKEKSIVVASVSPQWFTEFEGVSRGQFATALKQLGFTHVSESSLGAELSMTAEREKLRDKGGLGISARCPALSNYIMKKYPRLKQALLPVASPMIAHARMMKKMWGEGVRIIHISACVAAKDESDHYPGLIDVVLTFKELKDWLNNAKIRFENTSNEESEFETCEGGAGVEYPLCDSVLLGNEGVLTIHGCTVPEIKRLLDLAPLNTERPVLLNFMVCPEGCLGSNGSVAGKVSRITQRLEFERVINERKTSGRGFTITQVDMSRSDFEAATENGFVSESDIVSALDSLGFYAPNQLTDCGACGFDSCRRFVKALSRGEVKRELCWQFVNVELKSKFTALITRMSSGVAIVNAGMKIEEANRLIASMSGSEELYDNCPGLGGIDAAKVFPFSHVIASVLENGDDTIVRDFTIKEKVITVSVHTIEKYASVLVICRNMLFSQVRNEEIVKRTHKVIRENLETVQKIASLLGENASRTESILNSILSAQSGYDEE